MGAWIETSEMEYDYVLVHVAPLMGAWIETLSASAIIPGNLSSHLSWVRGLKRYFIYAVFPKT